MKTAILCAMILPLVMFACGTLTAADQASIAADSVHIAVCQAKARACKEETDASAVAATCWPVYDECMISAGLKDGGSHG